MAVLMITYQVADDGVAEVTSAIEKAFAAGPGPVPRPFELVGDYRLLGQKKQ